MDAGGARPTAASNNLRAGRRSQGVLLIDNACGAAWNMLTSLRLWLCSSSNAPSCSPRKRTLHAAPCSRLEDDDAAHGPRALGESSFHTTENVLLTFRACDQLSLSFVFVYTRDESGGVHLCL